MKILVATPFMSQHFDAGLFWAKALCSLWHSVILWDYRVQPEKITSLSNSAYDLALVFKGEGLDPRLLHTPKVCYWPDALERTPGIEEVLQHYTKVFTPVRPTPNWMEWMPSGWDPAIHRDLGLPRVHLTMYIGTNNSDYKREMIMGIGPEVVYGNEWRAERILVSGMPVYLHELTHQLNTSQILIDVHQSPTVGLNRKLFEMVACGFTLVDEVPGAREVLGDLPVYFQGVEEAKAAVAYYLAHPEERERIWALERKAIKPYTYENCVRGITRTV